MYEFSPPLDVKDIPWFINKPKKWTDWVHKTDCSYKFDQLMSYVEHFDLPVADRKKNYSLPSSGCAFPSWI